MQKSESWPWNKDPICRLCWWPAKWCKGLIPSGGQRLVDGFMIKEGDYKLVKTRFSASFATHLHSFLQSNGINIVVGVQTPNCIRQTVFGAVALDYQSVTVIVDARDCFPTTMPSLSALILQTSGCQEILLSPPTVPWMPRLLNYDACCTFPFLDMLVEHRKYGGMGSNTTWAAENEPAATATATTIPSSLSPLTSPWDWLTLVMSQPQHSYSKTTNGFSQSGAAWTIWCCAKGAFETPTGTALCPLQLFLKPEIEDFNFPKFHDEFSLDGFHGNNGNLSGQTPNQTSLVKALHGGHATLSHVFFFLFIIIYSYLNFEMITYTPIFHITSRILVFFVLIFQTLFLSNNLFIYLFIY